VSEQDPFGPTSAGPEPTPVVGQSDATFARPAGTAAGDGGDYRAPGGGGGIEEERPEVLVGAAFAGGVLAAMVLKRILRRR
jgi:hypothetical protein